MSITATVETVTPAIAEEWLGKNDSNRNLRLRIVASYARDMVAGNWRLSGEAIKFSRTGRLQDGQHRLHAVIQADATVQFLVVRGLAENIRDVLDSGTARTVGDALRMRGETAYSSLAAAARLAFLYTSGQPIDGGVVRATHVEVLTFIESNADLRPAVDLACGWRKHVDVPASVLSLAIWRLSQIDPDETYLFFSQLAEKTGFRSGDPALALNNRLTDIRRAGRYAARSDYLSLIFRAWNYFRSRKPVQMLPLKTRSGSSIEIPEPK